MSTPLPAAELRSPLPFRRTSVGRRRPRLAALAATLALAAAADVAAIGLGGVTQQSALGQSLRLVVPIIASAGDDVSADCFRLVPTTRATDGIPQITSGRIAVETTPAGSRLVVTSPRSVNDPVVRVTVEAGCDVSIRRDYTLLMDPLPIEAPTVAAESAPAPAAAAPVAGEAGVASADTARRGRAGAEGHGRAGGRAGTAAAPAPGARAAAKPRAKSRQPSTVLVPPPKTAPAPQEAQLKVSRAAPGSGREAAPTPEAALPTLQSQEDLANALEAETVVLRQRVAELSQSIERMQKEMAVAQAARVAAEEAAKASPWTTAARWWEGNWPFLAALIGVASLIAAGLLYRRRRNAAAGEWPMGALPEDRFDATYMDTAMPGVTEATGPQGAEVDTSQGAAPGASAARAARGAVDAASALAVSELSQVTEEARVFLQLGHVDRAMEVLGDHIAQQPRSMPAAWLMLLDLYRSHGREREFRKLADDFHLHFNAQTPAWGDLPTEDGDAGLEGFPHIVKQLTAAWGTPECRDLLDQLLYDTRKGRRGGFSFRAFSEILTLRQLLDLVLADIDSDVAEEQKVRAAWAAATGRAPPGPGAASPITLDLDLDLGRDAPAPGSRDPKPPGK